MQGVVESTVELGSVRAAEHHRKVFAVFPVRFFAQSCPNTLIKFRSRERIGNRYSDIVRPGFANQLNSLLDIAQGFAGITKLEKETSTNPVLPEIFTGTWNLGDECAFVHRIENLLRTGFHTHPHFGTAGPPQKTGG